MTRLRVALVLDNTGSMADNGKMTALKTATKNLLTQLQNAASKPATSMCRSSRSSRTSMSAPSNYNANWIDWTDWEEHNGSWQTTRAAIRQQRLAPRQESCNSNQTWVPDNHNTWNGCVTDRDQNYERSNTPPNHERCVDHRRHRHRLCSRPSSTAPARQQLMALSYNWTRHEPARSTTCIRTAIPTSRSVCNGAGCRLTAAAPCPFRPKDPNYQYTEVIILLTDGLNTQNRWTLEREFDRRPPADDLRQHQGRENHDLHDPGEYRHDPQQSVLQDCASDSSKFFYLTSSSQISGVFNTIGTNLSKLRIAK